jgi:hypothetical protein
MGSEAAGGVFTYVLGMNKRKVLLTPTKHLQIGCPSRARHKGFTEVAGAFHCL